jgi:hypothetical protein
MSDHDWANLQYIQEANERKSIDRLEDRCFNALASNIYEVTLSTREFQGKNVHEWDDYAIMIARARLRREGYYSGISIEMDDKCCKTILKIYPKPEQKTVTGEIKK